MSARNTTRSTAHHRAIRLLGWPLVLALALAAGVALYLVTGPGSGSRQPPGQALPMPSSPAPTPTTFAPPATTPQLRMSLPEPGPVMFTFVAAGDILPHMPVVTSARVSGDYDFEPLMRNIRPFIADADLAICHLEVPVAPMGQQPSGYPVFAGPRELVTALSIQGWDGCTTASNHSMDKGFAGVVATLDAFDEYRMGHVGTARTAQEAARAQTYVVRSGNRRINVANIAFSYGTNEMPVPVDAPWSINLFDADSADAQPIIDAAQAARDAGADVVIASVHCCVEYRTEPTPEQRILVERIAESGAVDLYVGHHTHVPQPIEKLAGGPHGDGMWAAFGLGNHLSNQDTQCCRAETNSGVLITATFDVAVDGTVTVGMEWTGTTVDRLDRHTMHILHDVQGGTGRISASDAKARYDRVANAVGPEAAERVEPPTSLADAAFVKKRKPWASEDANS